MSLPLAIVDAFTDRPFAGNPAAVCVLDTPRPDDWMQQVAAEMNLSETAFLLAEGGIWRLRWFTPAVEVDLCGHATLASAFYLWHSGRCPPGSTIRFQTRSGELRASPDGDWIELDFPALIAEPCSAPAGLADALGAPLHFVGNYRLDYLCELSNEDAVRDLRPDHARLQSLKTRGVVVTARSSRPGIDFVSRFFAPGAGIAEDPVTGSAHCALGPYWQGKLGRSELVGHQLSRRGGQVRVRVRGDRVGLGGRAVLVVNGALEA
jgi:PhzF family phenazine biosynthesis protein